MLSGSATLRFISHLEKSTIFHCADLTWLSTLLYTAGDKKDARVSAAIEDRVKLSKTLLEKALRYGFVETQMVVCLLIGIAGAGKTHTIHLLLQKSHPDYRNSIALVEKPVRAVRVAAMSDKLQEISTDELDRILADAVAAGTPQYRRTIFSNGCFGNDIELSTVSRGISQPSHSDVTSTNHFTDATHSEGLPSRSSSNDRICCCCCSVSHEAEFDLQEALDKTVHLITAAKITTPQQPLNGKWIYLIDSGGQVEFLEVLPAFLHHTSVCFFLTKLSEMFSDHPKMEYFEDGKSVGEPTVCAFTNEEMLMRCVQTIQSQCVLQDGNASQASKVVVVGTHQDLENECPESRDEKNQKLLSLLCPAFDQSLVFNGQQMKEIIFPLNAKNPGPHDHAVADELSNVIWNAASDAKPRKTPISWFKFEQYLQKLASQGTRILHRKKCFQVARFFHLSEKDFDAALDHLASFCVIHYYFHLLPDVVFIDPHFLVGVISEIVKYHYKIRHDSQLCKATGGELRKFQNEGCITLELLRKIPMQYTDFFTPADLLKLMEDRLIITQHINNDEYLMPCLLRTMDSKEVDQHRLKSSSPVAPLAIHFSCGWVPHGMYCLLVAFLRSQKPSPWKLSAHCETPTEPLCLTRNCIQFRLPGDAPGSLILIDSFSHFEVHVNAPQIVCSKLCPLIWQTLSKGLQRAKETLRYHSLEEPKRAFLCTHDHDQHTGRPHIASLADDFNYWSCDLYPDTVCGDLTDEHLMWFPERRGNNNSGRLCM